MCADGRIKLISILCFENLQSLMQSALCHEIVDFATTTEPDQPVYL